MLGCSGSQADAERERRAGRRRPRRALAGRGLALALALAAGPTPAAAAPAGASKPADASTDWAPDPVYVYYGPADCRSDTIEIEVWDRAAKSWRPDPLHPRVSIPSCRVEDAGVLLNELRWRCYEPGAEQPAAWRRLEVFDPEVMSRCAVEQIEAGERRTAISVLSPGEGVPVRAPHPIVPLVGSVRVDGLEGSDYDVVLALDRSTSPTGDGPDPLAAQVKAARSFVRRLAPRMRSGTVRIGVVSYPNLPPGPGESTAARRDLPLSKDPAAVDAALAHLPRRPVDALSTLGSALDLALDELAAGRARARGVVVAGFDGRESFGPGRGASALEAAAARAAEHGVTLHLFALGGLSERAPAPLESALEQARGSFTRVLPAALERDFLAEVELPVAEAVWIEKSGGATVGARVDAEGHFRALVPVEPGANELRIHARTTSGDLAERRFELVFDDALILEKVLEAERERIRRAQRKRLELRPEGPAPP